MEDGSNAEVKRNVNCDLYEKKGKLWGQSEVMFSAIYVLSELMSFCITQQNESCSVSSTLGFLFEKADVFLPCAVYVRKCIVGKGEDYRGKVFTTKNGHTCQQWWSKFPHDHR